MSNEQKLDRLATQLGDDVTAAALLYAKTKRKPMDRDAAELLAFVAGVEWCAARFPALIDQVNAMKPAEVLPGGSCP